MTDIKKPDVDIEQLLAEADLDDVLATKRVTIVDNPAKVNALLALQAEEKKLAAEEKAAKARREAIRGLIRKEINAGDEHLVAMVGDEPHLIAKMVYPEPTTRVNTEYVKEHFSLVDHPEMWTRTESTPRLTVVVPD